MTGRPDELPEFAYHPDPLSTGSARPSDEVCVCCSRPRGYVYTGPVYCVETLDGRLCLSCVANGSAAERFDATFGDVDAPEGVTADVVETIARRTPGFSGWQQARWLFHCGDGAAFLGAVGAAELAGDEEALASLRTDVAGIAGQAEWVEDYLAALDRDGQPTAYLFECRSCGTHLAYSDST